MSGKDQPQSKWKLYMPNFFNHMQFYNHQIMKYDPEYLFSYGFINPKASVLSWGMIFSNSDAPKHSLIINSAFLSKIMVSTEGLIFASLVSFLLGMFISSTFTRWWSCRSCLGTIMNSTGILVVLLHSFSDAKDPQAQAIVEKIKRLMHLAHGLVHKQANDHFDLKDLIDKNICTLDEASVISKCTSSMPALVYSWVMDNINLLVVGKKISLEAEMNIMSCVSNSNNAAQDLMMLLKTQMPYSYLHLLTLITKIHLAFICFYSGGIIAGGITGYAWTRILFGYVVVITNNLIYEGLLRIHSILVNPCGDDIGDFPTGNYWQALYGLTSIFIVIISLSFIDIEANLLSKPVPLSADEREEEIVSSKSKGGSVTIVM